uniref:Putative secreted protein n=1 Tax=Ixodes ricinus TaxID=34613 RepID=A0A6B0UT57_IXORI
MTTSAQFSFFFFFFFLPPFASCFVLLCLAGGFSFLSPCARRATLEPNCVVRKKKRAPLYAFFFSLNSVDFFSFLPSFASCFVLLRRGLRRFSFLSSCARRATPKPNCAVQKKKKKKKKSGSCLPVVQVFRAGTSLFCSIA